VSDRRLRPPTTPDVFSAPLVLDGLVIGGWKRSVTSRGLTVALTPATPMTSTARRAVRDAAARYAAFLGSDIECLEA